MVEISSTRARRIRELQAYSDQVALEEDLRESVDGFFKKLGAHLTPDFTAEDFLERYRLKWERYARKFVHPDTNISTKVAFDFLMDDKKIDEAVREKRWQEFRELYPEPSRKLVYFPQSPKP